MVILDLLRWGNLLIWVVAVCLLFKPFSRYMRGSAQGGDDWWSYAFFVSAIFIFWGLRNVAFGSIPSGESYTATCLLHLLNTGLGAITLRRWRSRRS